MSTPSHGKLLTLPQPFPHTSLCHLPICWLPIVTHLVASPPISPNQNCQSASSLLVGFSVSPLLLFLSLQSHSSAEPYPMHIPIPIPQTSFHPSASYSLLPNLPPSAAASTQLCFADLSLRLLHLYFFFIYCLFHKKVCPPGEKTEYMFLVILYTGLVH